MRFPQLVHLLCLGAFITFALNSQANVVGSDAQNFNPTTNGLDFVTVQSSSTLEPGIFNLGLFTNYAKNALPYYDSANSGAKRGSSLVGGDLNFGLGLARGWDTGLSFPFILSQQVDAGSTVGRYSSTGNTEVRFNTKYRLFGNQRHGFALVASANFNRISQNPYIGEGGGPIYNLEFAYKTMFGPASWGLNAGYRWRNPGTPIANSGIEPLPDQWIASTALSYRFDSIDTKAVLEFFAAIPKQSQLQSSTDRQYSVMEALLGLKYDASTHIALHFGAGSGLGKGISSPDYRVYAGLNWAFGSVRAKPSAQNDPYATPRPRRIVRETPAVAARPPAPPTVAKVTPPAPLPAPAPALVVEEDVPPAISTETVSDVAVFNRGSFNHIVLQNIEFIGNTMTLKPESQKYLLHELAPAIKELNGRKPIATIVVEGHTDGIGGKTFNLTLSKARAQIVSALLRQHLAVKIPIQAVGLGSSKPIADNGNYQGRALNQRVEIKLLYQSPAR